MTETILDLAETLAARLSWTDVLDIVLVAGAIYVLLKLIEGRRASQMAFGTVIVGGLLLLTGSSQLGLTTVQWIVRNTLPYLGIALIVLYQAEIRIGLARIGGGGFLRSRRRDLDPQRAIIATLIEAASDLSRHRVGAIVVWQGNIGLKGYADSGMPLDAKLSRELLVSLFQPTSPLHDGAAIVSGDRIVAARCVLPPFPARYGGRLRRNAPPRRPGAYRRIGRHGAGRLRGDRTGERGGWRPHRSGCRSR